MSLTKNDLVAIRQLMDERLDEKLEPIKIEQQRQGEVQQSQGEVQQRQGEVQQKQGKTLEYLKKKVARIDKTVNIIARTYDERINKIEKTSKNYN